MAKQLPRHTIPILVILILFALISIFNFQKITTLNEKLIEVQNNRYQSYLLTTLLRRSSDELTRLARIYVITGNKKFEEQFWQVLAIRNGQSNRPEHYDRIYWDFLAIEDGKAPFESITKTSLRSLMKISGITTTELELLEKSQNNSNKLVNLEKKAFYAMQGLFEDSNGHFTLKGTPDQQLAIDLLHSEAYHQAKIDIMKPINTFYEYLDRRTNKAVLATAKNLEQTNRINEAIILISIILLSILVINANLKHRQKLKVLDSKIGNKERLLSKSKEDLKSAKEQIKTLSGIIPICSCCHSIRDKSGDWHILETYISNHSDARFSHGYCPVCEQKVRDELDID